MNFRERRRLASNSRQRPFGHLAGDTPAVTGADEETLADGVNYGIADCRRRLRSRRSSLRAQCHPPKIELGEPSPAAAQLEEREEAVIT